jgi:hypothetical protein
MRREAAPRRQPPRHHIETHAASHRAPDFSSPYTAGPINLAPAQFKDVYQHNNPIRNQYRKFMRVKTPYSRARR